MNPVVQQVVPPLTAVVCGGGVIGSHLVPLIGRLPYLREVRIVDRDVVDDSNVASQAIFLRDVGRSKAKVLAAQLRAINPALEVEAVHSDLVDLALGYFRADVVFSCLDSRKARRVVAEAAWKVGAILIDAGVGQPALARVAAFVPGKEEPCYQCQHSPEDYAREERWSCTGESVPPPSRTPAYLGALAASLQAAEFYKLASGDRENFFGGRELLFDATHQRSQETRLRRFESCRFDHRTFGEIEDLEAGPRWTSLSDALSPALAREGMPSAALAEEGSVRVETSPPRPREEGGEVILEVPGRLFVKSARCVGCGRSRRLLRLNRGLGARAMRCGGCGGEMAVGGVDLDDRLLGSDLSAAQRRKSMASLGFRPGDVFTVWRGKKGQHFQFALEKGTK